ncbi:MAG: molybdopterin-dependent oxidoreductase, partial [Nocardioides sp.]|nr:molybdopterin-dependent oxidoreductase [Nocardioides sp.]
NPMASNGSLMTAPDFPQRLRDLKARGGQVVVVDPRRTETAKVATAHHFVRPGTDAVVLLAMLHVLFAEGLTAPPPYVDNVARVEELVAEFTPERAEPLSGVPAETIRQLTRDFAAADGAAAYGRVGVSTHGFGSICQWAIQCLNLLTGNFDREGGVLFPEPAVDIVGRRVIGPGHFDAWRSRVRDFPEFAGELPVSTLREEIETPGEGQIRAMVTMAGNPVLSTPDGRSLARAFDGLDFMVAVDIYLNETTRHADVILPPTSALERDQYDLVFHNLAVRNTSRYTPAVFSKGDDQRHDWQIFAALATRLQKRLGTKAPLKARLVARARMAASPAVVLTGLLATGRKVSMRRLRAHPEGVDLGPLRPTMPERLQTKGKRIDLAAPLVVGDFDRLRASLSDGSVPDPDALLLIGRRHKQDCNSWMHNTPRLTRGKPRHHLLMHPDDLAARGIADGARVTVTSRVGSVEVEATGVDDMMPGVVSLPHGYGHQVAGTRLAHAQGVAGVSINELTDPELLDVSGNAAFNGVPVTVNPAS